MPLTSTLSKWIPAKPAKRCNSYFIFVREYSARKSLNSAAKRCHRKYWGYKWAINCDDNFTPFRQFTTVKSLSRTDSRSIIPVALHFILVNVYVSLMIYGRIVMTDHRKCKIIIVSLNICTKCQQIGHTSVRFVYVERRFNWLRIKTGNSCWSEFFLLKWWYCDDDPWGFSAA